MSIVGSRHYLADINVPPARVQLGAIADGDQEEMVCEIRVMDGKSVADCTGAQAVVYVVRADRQTVFWNAEAGRDGVRFRMPEAAHAVAGRFAMAVRLTLGEVKHTVFLAEGSVITTRTDALLNAGQPIPNIDDLLAQIGRMEAATERSEQATAAMDAKWAGYDARLLETDERVKHEARRISNLEAAAEGNLYRAETDDDPAYQKAVPADAMSLAMLDRFGGKTLVWNQLLDGGHNSKGTTSNGITWNVNDDGTVTANGTATALSQFIIWRDGSAVGFRATPGHKYLSDFGVGEDASNGTYYATMTNNGGNGMSNNIGLPTIRVATSDSGAGVLLRVGAGYTANNVVFKPQLFDLTMMFGPDVADTITTPEQAYALGVPRNYQPYSAPTLRNFALDHVVSSSGQTIDLSALVGKYFPDGMRSAGDVCDSFEADDEGKWWAIRRVSNDVAGDGLAFIALTDPVRTEVTENFPSDLKVEAGGGLTFVNQHGDDFRVPLPNQVTYMIKLGGAAQ